MQPRTRFGRFLSYALLLLGGSLFLSPLVWMVSTSLKPLEQTNATPPQWIPYAHEAELNGRTTPIILGQQLHKDKWLIEVLDGPLARTRRLVELGDFVAAQAGSTPRGRAHLAEVGGLDVNAQVVKRAEAGWYLVRERTFGKASPEDNAWDVVPGSQIHSHPKFFWSNYPDAIRKMGTIEVWIPFLGSKTMPIFWIYLRNSILVAGLGVLGTLVSCSLAAYSLARIPWRGSQALFAITLATMMIPFPVMMVPLYSLFRSLGWLGTLMPLWVPTFFGSGFNIFLLRQFFTTIPRELSEAARMDGCSELGILWRVILPLSKPALAVVGMFHFFYAWNDFVGPLLFLTRRETFTLSLGLQSYQSQHGGTDWNSLMAASTLVCLPVILLFFLTQRAFFRGVTTAGLRG